MLNHINNNFRRMRRKLNTVGVAVCLTVVIIYWFFLMPLPICRQQSADALLSSSHLSQSEAIALTERQIPEWVTRYNISHLFDWTWYKNGDFRQCRVLTTPPAASYACKAQSPIVVNDALDYFRFHADEGCIVDNLACPSDPSPHPMPRARSLSDTCSSLHIDRKWVLCRKSQSEMNSLISTARRFVTVAVSNAFVDPGTCHPDVPGIIFTHRATFHPQRWTGKECGNDAISVIPKINNRYRYTELIDSIGNYLQAPGHFGPEQLPRLIRLLATAPTTAKVLVAKGGIADAFVDVLVERGVVTRDRIVPYDNYAHTNYFGNIVYRSEIWPFLRGEDISYFLYDSTNMQLVHRTFVSNEFSTIEKRDRIILIKRNNRAARSIIEHSDMLAFMASALNASNLFSKFRIEVFEATGHLRDHIALFRQARVIVGPHGAGMMNVLWAAPETHVVEVGYDSGMTYPQMYAMMSLHLEHHYWICKGRGDYSAPIHVDMDDFIYIFNQIIQELKTEA